MTTDDPLDDDEPDGGEPDGESGAGLFFLGRTPALPGTGISTPDELVELLVQGGVPAERVAQQTMVTVTISDTEWLSLVPRFDDVGSYWYIHRYRNEQHWVHETPQPHEAVGFVAATFARSTHVNGSPPDTQAAGAAGGGEHADGAS